MVDYEKRVFCVFRATLRHYPVSAVAQTRSRRGFALRVPDAQPAKKENHSALVFMLEKKQSSLTLRFFLTNVQR
jgi:hypothetical protein